MVLHIMMKNFGKVESADISLHNLVVLVGNNNSGKTMVMQLIYGLRERLKDFQVPAAGAKITDLDGQYLIRCDRDWLGELESRVNEYLDMNKAQIVENIFGSPIPAEEIRVAFEGVEATYFVSSVSKYRSRDVGKQRTELSIDTRQYENGENIRSYGRVIFEVDDREDEAQEALQMVWDIILSGGTAVYSRQLFLPASRSGLQLLYKHYFATEAGGGLVMPIRDFLRFLQLYSEDQQPGEARRALLEFGEEHLLMGKVVQRGDETFYVDRHVDGPLPLYIASSMIHELTPFIKALSAEQRPDWLYCDEVENSLHPLLQREMARWLVRMANAGMHVIISSHSDTMASRLNNLFMLTQLNKRKADYGLLSELGLQEVDLLRPNVEASVYEFQSGGQGRTTVEKLEFISHPLMGYDFRLFGSNLDKLYEEADKITR